MRSDEIFQNIKNNYKSSTAEKSFNPNDVLEEIGLRNKKNNGENGADFTEKDDVKLRNNTVDYNNFVKPQEKSYYVAGPVANNEISSTAQTPEELEYEANTADDEKQKDNYFALTKLPESKKDIIKNIIKTVVQSPNVLLGTTNAIGKLTGKTGEDVVMEGLRGFANSSVDFASSMSRFFGQNYMYFKGYKDEQLDKIANLGNVISGGEDLSDEIKQKYTDFYNRIDKQTQIFKDKTEKFLQYTGIAKTDKDGFIYDLVGGVSSLMYGIGIAVVTKSPLATAEFFGAYQYQGLYEEAIEKGFSPIKARKIGLFGGIAEAVLECFGLDVLFKTLVARKSFTKILIAIITEFIQEASQQGAEEIITNVGGLRNESLRNILFNVGYAGVIGALLGGSSAGVSNMRYFQKKISDSAVRELIKIGCKSEYAKLMVNNMLDFSVSPQVADEMEKMLKDEQSPVTYKKSDPRETYKECGETIKKALNPQEKRNIEIEFIKANKKFTQQYADVLYNSGKFKTKDEAYRQAETATAQFDVLAREAYNQDDISPEQYYQRFHINAQTANIEMDERNVDEDNPFYDVSFDPVDFDETARAEYEAAMDAEQEYIDSLQEENKSTLKSEARILGDMGIGAIRKPTPDGYGKERWSEYNDLSPRIKKYFFTDSQTAMKWDEAEDLLANSGSSIKDLFEYLTAVDNRAVKLNQEGVFSRLLNKEKENIKQQTIANGTFMKAPNGKESNLSENLWLIVRTKAFKSWFGDWENDPKNASKVVDENGEPLVVYHGTANDFTVFDKNKSYQGLFWFSNDYNKVNAGYDGATGKGIVMPVFLKIKNAADWDLYDKYSPEELENMKYDGLLLKDGNETVVVAFEPNQIKSINNRGSFDNNNPDIYFQDGSPQVAPLSEQIKKKISDLEEQRVYENKYGQTIDLDKSLRVFKKEAEKYAVEERKSYLLDLLDNDKDKFIDEFGKSNIQEMLDDYNSDNEEQIESVQEALNNDDIRADIKNVIEDTTGYEIENSEQYHNLLRKYGNYIDNRINVLADILKEKGYKVKIDKSNMSESNYIYLPEQEVSIRLSEHTDRYDNDIDLKYSDSIEKNIKNIEECFQEKFYQDAYHGTPHRFEEFSTDNIGTGEGAQVHGWGLYFAKNLSVADSYKFKLTPKTAELYIDPKDFTINDKEHYYIKDGKFYRNNFDDTNEQEIAKTDYSKALRKAQDLNKKAMEEDEKKGQLFKVDIPENDVLLDEDKTFQEQPEKVQKALIKIGEDLTDEQMENLGYNSKDKKQREYAKKFYSDVVLKGDVTGKGIYETIWDMTGDAKQASLLLNKYGIKGITYDGQQDGRCFVIFDDKAVKVLEKFYQSRADYNVAPLKLNTTNISQNANLKELKNKNNGNLDLHTKAKAGDVKTAVELVKRVVKQNVLDDLKQLAKEHKTAVVLPLLAKEETGHNKLPRAYADIIADATGLKVDNRIKQINKTNHTKEDRTERLTDLAKFDGKVVKGQEYILVDDVLTTGSNINELRKYIERRGGKVIHVAVLATGIRGKEVFQPVVAETKKNLYDKFERVLNGQEKTETNITNKQQQQQEQNVDTTGNRRNDGRFPQGQRNSQRVRSESDLHRLVNLYLQSKNITNSVEELTEGQARDMLSDKFVIDEKHLFELLNSQFFQEQQQQDNPRGATTVFDRQYWIELYSSADKSTLLHESSHAFLSEVLYFANGKNPSAKILNIKKQLDDWLGVPENNGRYSTRQQELFAKSSETYFREGKAPTAKLKTVFERFKKWLANIYDSIKDDLPKINDDVRELFDTILSRSYDVPDSNIYAGKEKAIKEVIKNINEGRASEVDGITIDDVYNLLNVAYVRKPSKPTKNLKQLLNEKNIYDFNELNKAGADTVFRILKDGGYIKEDATAEQAVDLAKQALDGSPVYRLADQWRVAGDVDFARNLRILEKVIEFSQIDSVLEKILNLQQEGYRNVEQTDIDKIQNDYRKLFTADVKDAKKIVEDIIKSLHKKRFIDNAAKKQMIVDLNFSSTIEEIKETVLDVIEDLKEEIKLVKEQLRNPRKPIVRKDKTVLPNKNASNEEKNSYKKYMRRQINRLLKQVLPAKQNNNKVSKFGNVEIQRFFDELMRINKMSKEEAQQFALDRIANNNKWIIADEKGEGFENKQKIINMFVGYKAKNITQNSCELLKELYDSLVKINIAGRNEKKLNDFLKKEQINKNIDELLDNIEKNKSKNKISKWWKKFYGLSVANWYSFVNAVAGEKQAEKNSLELLEKDVFVKAKNLQNKIIQRSCKALGIKTNTQFDKKINDYLGEKYEFVQTEPNHRGEEILSKKTLNKMELICCYIWSKNAQLKERIISAFGNEQFAEMMAKLDKSDIAWGDIIQEEIASLYNDVNAVYVRMYGLDMPQTENYFPSSTERIQGNMDLLKDAIVQTSSPGFLKSRVESNWIRMKFDNPIRIAFNHIFKATRFYVMQEKLAEIYKTYLGHVVVSHKLNEIYGTDQIFETIKKMIDNVKFDNFTKQVDIVNNMLDTVANTYVLTRIAGKASIMIKQLLSFSNYMEDVDSGLWIKHFVKMISNPLKFKEVKDFMYQHSPYLKLRYESGAQNEALEKAMEAQSKTIMHIKTFKGFLSLMTRVGDIGAIIFGGYPMVQAQIEKGVSIEKAFENFEKATLRSQQANFSSTLSNWQNYFKKNAFLRAIFAFTNTPNQYTRKLVDVCYKMAHGDDKLIKGKGLKTLVLYGLIQSLLYNSFTSLGLLSGWFGGDWDDLENDIWLSVFQVSNFLAFPFFGQLYEILVSIFVSGYVSEKRLPIIDDVTDFYKAVKKAVDSGIEDMSVEDWIITTDKLASITTGIPLETLYNTYITSWADIINGDYGKGFVKLYGATQKRAEKIFDN